MGYCQKIRQSFAVLAILMASRYVHAQTEHKLSCKGFYGEPNIVVEEIISNDGSAEPGFERHKKFFLKELKIEYFDDLDLSRLIYLYSEKSLPTDPDFFSLDSTHVKNRFGFMPFRISSLSKRSHLASLGFERIDQHGLNKDNVTVLGDGAEARLLTELNQNGISATSIDIGYTQNTISKMNIESELKENLELGDARNFSRPEQKLILAKDLLDYVDVSDRFAIINATIKSLGKGGEARLSFSSFASYMVATSVKKILEKNKNEFAVQILDDKIENGNKVLVIRRTAEITTYNFTSKPTIPPMNGQLLLVIDLLERQLTPILKNGQADNSQNAKNSHFNENKEKAIENAAKEIIRILGSKEGLYDQDKIRAVNKLIKAYLVKPLSENDLDTLVKILTIIIPDQREEYVMFGGNSGQRKLLKISFADELDKRTDGFWAGINQLLNLTSKQERVCTTGQCSSVFQSYQDQFDKLSLEQMLKGRSKRNFLTNGFESFSSKDAKTKNPTDYTVLLNQLLTAYGKNQINGGGNFKKIEIEQNNRPQQQQQQAHPDQIKQSQGQDPQL